MKNISFFPRKICFFLLFFLFPVITFSVPVNFVVPASGEGLNNLLRWNPIIKFIRTQTGLDINLIIARDHEVIRDGLINKNYDFALIDPFWYIHWRDGSFCLPFMEVKPTGSEDIRSVLIVHRDSVYRSIEDLNSAGIALNVPDDSAVGFYIPLAVLFSQGIDPFSYFNAIVFPGTFESILKGVAYGKLDSGFISSTILDDIKQSRYAGNIRIILESSGLSDPLIVVRKDFNGNLLDQISLVLNGIDTAEGGSSLLFYSDIRCFSLPVGNSYENLVKYLDILEQNNAAPE